MFSQKTVLALCLSSLLMGAPAVAAPVLSTDAPAAVNTRNTNAWMEIDVQAFEDNIRTLQNELAGKSQICAIMKADAYGNGIDLLMPSVIKMGVPCIGIASNEEARVIRAHGYPGKIVRVRMATDDEIRDGLQYDMEELLGNPLQAQRISAIAGAAGKTVRFHLALNSAGMNRNGIDLSARANRRAAVRMTWLPHLALVGIMTHFPVEEAADVRKGLAAFNQESAWLIQAAKLDRSKLTLHAANSFTTLAVPEARLDMVRPGGLLYGDTIPEHTEYKKTFALKSRVAAINAYPKGTTVGYDRTYTLTRDSHLANLPIGYSDGYRRVFTNKGHVLIRGHKVPVVGKTSMNTTMVDVTDYPDIAAGDEVVLFGRQDNSEITQSEIEEINGALLADLYTVWGNANPKLAKPAPLAPNE
ncbi:alanine racemase [Uruburuella testudinis]|uniref:Broad specificity amino-acid racemase n=1 Tax=Uruburuella testudinis TaxID=1282863 RepID=A0ABY4DSB9_9NEIS|nr:alanine racemase [Uruburuella testudinis]UOO81932.1 alanine racemase [Uruburuella testudinis]